MKLPCVFLLLQLAVDRYSDNMATVRNKWKGLKVEGEVKVTRHIENGKKKADWCREFGLVRKILGPTKEVNGIWRIETNKELDELIKHRKVINYVKAQKLSWFGFVNRMLETSTVKRIHKWKPFTGRPAGRPKSRWEDDVRNDLKKMKLTKWTEQVQDRLKWKEIVAKVKTVPEL
jgi:hypothetical protein